MTRGTDLEKRTEKALVSMGYLVHRTHNSRPVFSSGRWISPTKNDILGAFDCLAISHEYYTRLVQSTTLGHISHKKKKIDALIPWRVQGVCIEVWGWHKVKGRWVARVWRRGMSGEWLELGEGVL